VTSTTTTTSTTIEKYSLPFAFETEKELVIHLKRTEKVPKENSLEEKNI
jgi:hypothetical protein